VARNRKRRSDRRPTGRPSDDAIARRGLATANGARHGEDDEAPDPIEHAAPDVELAEAQLAVGRPEAPIEQAGDDESVDEDPELDEEEFEEEVEASISRRDVAARSSAAPSPRLGSRLIHFLQGSWRELQRVQWPDRRQVMQATGVVIGFVIIAGAFLGVADFVATKVVNFILK
jgi:preprotein translocase subunit SecE